MDQQWHNDKFVSGSDTYANGRYQERAHKELMAKLSPPTQPQQFSHKARHQPAPMSANDIETAGQGFVVLGGALAVIALAAFIGLALLFIVAVAVPIYVAYDVHRKGDLIGIISDGILGACIGFGMYLMLSANGEIHWGFAAYFGFIFGSIMFLWTDSIDRFWIAETIASKIRRGIVEYGACLTVFIGYWLIIEYALTGGL